MHPVGVAGDDIADRALVDLLDGLFEGLVVAAHQSAGDLEIMRLGGLGPPARSGVCRGRRRRTTFP